MDSRTGSVVLCSIVNWTSRLTCRLELIEVPRCLCVGSLLARASQLAPGTKQLSRERGVDLHACKQGGHNTDPCK